MWGFVAVLVGLTLLTVALDPWLAPDDIEELLRQRKRDHLRRDV